MATFSRRDLLCAGAAAVALASLRTGAAGATASPVVIDVGSEVTKGGGSGDHPQALFPTVVGTPLHEGVFVGMGQKNAYVGEDVNKLKAKIKMSVTHPVEHGTVIDWNAIERVYRHVYENELHVDATTRPILVTQKPLASKESREKILNILFNVLNVPSLFIGSDAVLALTAAGLRRGTVVSIGGGVTYVTPVNDMTILEHVTKRLSLGGRTLSESMAKMIGVAPEAPVARTIKEKFGYVALDPQKERPKPETFAGPQRSFTVSAERFKCPEAIFHPDLAGVQSPGLHILTHEAIQGCDASLRAEMYGNIVLEGGSSLFHGLAERLQKELEALAPGKKIRIVASPERKFAAWRGGVTLASADSFRASWITKDEFQKSGSAIIHRKSF